MGGHIGIGIFNFSLCILSVLFLSPFTLLACPVKNFALRLVTTVVVLAMSPFVFLWGCCIVSTDVLRSLEHAHIHWHAVGAMQLPFFCLAVFPLYTLGVRLLWHVPSAGGGIGDNVMFISSGKNKVADPVQKKNQGSTNQPTTRSCLT